MACGVLAIILFWVTRIHNCHHTALKHVLLHYTLSAFHWVHCCHQLHCCTAHYPFPKNTLLPTALLHCSPLAHAAQITRSSANFLFVAPSNGWSGGLELIETHQKLAAPAQRTHQRIMTSVIGFSIIHAVPVGDWIFIISRQIDALIFSRRVDNASGVKIYESVLL